MCRVTQGPAGTWQDRQRLSKFHAFGQGQPPPGPSGERAGIMMTRETDVTDFGTQRLNMVESQVRPSDVTDRHLMAAMQGLPRERFMPDWSRPLAYVDGDAPVARTERGSPSRYLLAPRTLAKLVQAAAIGSSDSVLDIGCASGYSTALVAQMAARVVGLEVDATLAGIARDALAEAKISNAQIEVGPLAQGWVSKAPYDVLILNGAVPAVPATLLAQLREGGRLVAVVTGERSSRMGSAMLLTKRGEAIARRILFDAGAPYLPGFEVDAGFAF